jgi:hypothetical protein
MTKTRIGWMLCSAGMVAACAGPVQGPDVTLATVARPEPLALADLARPLPQPTPGPIPGGTMLRAWLPRQVTANGDAVEGHWIEISATPPVVERVAPDKPFPHAGPHIVHPTEVRPTPPATQPAPRSPQSTQPLPGLPPETAALLQQWQRGLLPQTTTPAPGGLP